MGVDYGESAGADAAGDNTIVTNVGGKGSDGGGKALVDGQKCEVKVGPNPVGSTKVVDVPMPHLVFDGIAVNTIGSWEKAIFDCKVEGTKLTVRRTDVNKGWIQPLSLIGVQILPEAVVEPKLESQSEDEVATAAAKPMSAPPLSTMVAEVQRPVTKAVVLVKSGLATAEMIDAIIMEAAESDAEKLGMNTLDGKVVGEGSTNGPAGARESEIASTDSPEDLEEEPVPLQPFTVQLTRPLGISFAGDGVSGCYITRVKNGSAAHMTKQISSGMRIISVNGASTKGHSQATISNLIASVGRSCVHLELALATAAYLKMLKVHKLSSSGISLSSLAGDEPEPGLPQPITLLRALPPKPTSIKDQALHLEMMNAAAKARKKAKAASPVAPGVKVIERKSAKGKIGLQFITNDGVRVISQIKSGSPAEDAGLTVGDVIMAVNGTPISAATDAQTLRMIAKGGKKIAIAINTTIRYRQEVQPDSATMDNSTPEPQIGIKRRWDSVMQRTSATEKLGLSLVRKGTSSVVSGVAPNSPAERAGLKIGETISTVNGKDVSALEHEDILNKLLHGGVATAVGTWRGPGFASGTLKEQPARVLLIERKQKRVAIGLTYRRSSDGSIEVVTAEEGTPGYTAGIRVGDRMLGINGKKLLGEDHLRNEIVGRLKFAVAVSSNDAVTPRTRTLLFARQTKGEALGLTLKTDRGNCMVHAVTHGSTAQVVGLRTGDRIVSVNGKWPKLHNAEKWNDRDHGKILKHFAKAPLIFTVTTSPIVLKATK
jgi:predicted metalloprotease with PDZ domain